MSVFYQLIVLLFSLPVAIYTALYFENLIEKHLYKNTN